METKRFIHLFLHAMFLLFCLSVTSVRKVEYLWSLIKSDESRDLWGINWNVNVTRTGDTGNKTSKHLPVTGPVLP